MVQRFGFIDEDGDGINDLARDADNDGIPNCLDPDWTRPEDGTGYKNKYGYKHQLANTQNHGGANNFNYSYNYLWNQQLGRRQRHQCLRQHRPDRADRDETEKQATAIDVQKNISLPKSQGEPGSPCAFY